MGSGIGGMIFKSLLRFFIVYLGWRMTFKILAVIMFIVIDPFTHFVIRISPRNLGLLPYGNSNNIDTVYKLINKKSLMLSEALKTKKF